MSKTPEPPKPSKDQQKLNDFFNFKINDQKFHQIQQHTRKKVIRFTVTGVIFGFFTEWLLGNGKIYDNIVKKSTMRRLSKYR